MWECSLVWAELLIDLHVSERGEATGARPREEDVVRFDGRDRHLVAILIAAGLHERILRLNLSFPDAVFVPLAAPQEEGVTGTLRRAAYAALDLSPDLEDHGSASRAVLVAKALSAHPDDRGGWERIRAAALEVVDTVAERTPAWHTGRRHPDVRSDGPYWERGITIGDVLIGEQRRRQVAQLAEIYDED